MILSNKHKFIFIKTPKTAGTSVQMALKQICAYTDIVMYGMINEMTKYKLNGWSEFVSLFDIPFLYYLRYQEKIKLNDYFSFSFVRNPWSKLISRYLYLIKRKVIDEKYKAGPVSFNNWIKNEWIFDHEKHIHDNPMTWICHPDGQIAIDFVGRYETLQQDFRYICYKINAINLELYHCNKAQIDVCDYRSWYTQETKNIVKDICELEIKTFNYDF